MPKKKAEDRGLLQKILHGPEHEVIAGEGSSIGPRSRLERDTTALLSVSGPHPEPRLEFETVLTTSSSVTQGKGMVDLKRFKVPGGWLVALANAKSLCFYPDPEHTWWNRCPGPDCSQRFNRGEGSYTEGSVEACSVACFERAQADKERV